VFFGSDVAFKFARSEGSGQAADTILSQRRVPGDGEKC
jgi:hypothetical protein